MTDEAEEWRAVVGWEGLYEVSSLGRVRSLDRVELVAGKHGSFTRRRSGKVLRPGPAGLHGQYLQVVLISSVAGRHNRLVQDLVLSAFTGPRPAGQEASHHDGNPANNRSANLIWESHVANMARQWQHETIRTGEGNGNHHLTSAEVAEIRLLKGVQSSRKVAAQFKCGATTVKGIWRGERRQHD